MVPQQEPLSQPEKGWEQPASTTIFGVLGFWMSSFLHLRWRMFMLPLVKYVWSHLQTLWQPQGHLTLSPSPSSQQPGGTRTRTSSTQHLPLQEGAHLLNMGAARGARDVNFPPFFEKCPPQSLTDLRANGAWIFSEVFNWAAFKETFAGLIKGTFLVSREFHHQTLRHQSREEL